MFRQILPRLVSLIVVIATLRIARVMQLAGARRDLTRLTGARLWVP